MAPPSKRRKLSSSGSSARIYRDNSTALDTLPSFSHSVQSMHGCATPDSPQLQHSPTPTDNALHHELKRDAVEGVDHFAGIAPRQDSYTELPTTMPTLGPTLGIQTFTDASTTLTYTPPALPSLPTLPSIPGATTFSSTTLTSSTLSTPSPDPYPSSNGNLSSSSSPSSSSSSSSTTTTIPGNITSSTSASSSLVSLTNVPIGNNGTIASRTAVTVTSSVSSTLYYTTLEDGNVSTITLSSGTFTTIVDGEVFTVTGNSVYSDSQAPLQSPTSTTTSDGQSTTSTSAVSGAGAPQTYGTPANTGAAGSTSTDASNTDDNGNHNSTPPAGTIAGGVVGGAAGLAVILLIAMLFVRWYRRRSQMRHQALPPGTAGGGAEQSRSAPGMAERAGMAPFAAAIPALFRHQNPSTEPGQSERGFTRVSGRKLPSQWSEGMSSSQLPNMPQTIATSGEGSAGRNLDNTSFYRNSPAFDGGNDGDLSPSAASPESIDGGPLRTSDPGSVMMMSRGPERQPEVHHGSPLQRPGQASTLSTSPSAASALGRSETPSSMLEPNRSSRFTEDM